MMRINWKVAYAAAVFTFGSTTATTDCHPPYVSGRRYAIGDWISASVVSSVSPISYTACSPPGVDDCPTSGLKREGGLNNISEMFNLQCISDDMCSSDAYAPGSMNSGKAWTREMSPCSPIAMQSSHIVDTNSLASTDNNYIITQKHESMASAGIAASFHRRRKVQIVTTGKPTTSLPTPSPSTSLPTTAIPTSLPTTASPTTTIPTSSSSPTTSPPTNVPTTAPTHVPTNLPTSTSTSKDTTLIPTPSPTSPATATIPTTANPTTARELKTPRPTNKKSPCKCICSSSKSSKKSPKASKGKKGKSSKTRAVRNLKRKCNCSCPSKPSKKPRPKPNARPKPKAKSNKPKAIKTKPKKKTYAELFQ